MYNPFKIEGPAVVSFSGGRTSAYMLHRILDAWDGQLPEDVIIAFANTGKERLETLDFVQACSNHWGCHVVWLEYTTEDEGFEVVGHNSASRDGGPFASLIEKRSLLPNPVTRFCTTELKIRPMKKYLMSLGFEHWDNVVGIRYDEPARVARMSVPNSERWENVLPLNEAKTTEIEVLEFWQDQPFDLQLRPHEGNCDNCFLKGKMKIEMLLAEFPESAQWWIEQEEKRGATFRNNRTIERMLARATDPERQALLIKNTPTTEEYLAKLKSKPEEALQMFLFDETDELGDCICNA